jgi:hypothetical protein
LQAVERSSSGTSDGQKITFNIIKSRLGDLMYKITSQKFEDPADGEEKVRLGHLTLISILLMTRFVPLFCRHDGI